MRHVTASRDRCLADHNRFLQLHIIWMIRFFFFFKCYIYFGFRPGIFRPVRRYNKKCTSRCSSWVRNDHVVRETLKRIVYHEIASHHMEIQTPGSFNIHLYPPGITYSTDGRGRAGRDRACLVKLSRVLFSNSRSWPAREPLLLLFFFFSPTRLPKRYWTLFFRPI